MQFATLKNGLKPLAVSVSFLAHGPAFSFAYNDSELSSGVKSAADPNVYEYLSRVNNAGYDYTEITLKTFFEDCYNRWEINTLFYSFSNQIVEEDNFRKMVAMGKKATPFILEKLKEKPSLIVWALNIIYDKKISDNPKTTIEEACELWIKHLS